jgi:hypothetical protein
MVCQYPLKTTVYSSLSSLLSYIWGKRGFKFQQNLASIPTTAQTLPFDLTFFTDSQRHFPGWKCNALPVQNYMRNSDTTKEATCAVTQARDVIDFSECNDKNFVALRDFTVCITKYFCCIYKRNSNV